MNDRRNRVEESERGFAGRGEDRLGEGGRGEGASGNDYAVPAGRRQTRDLFATNLDQRVLSYGAGHGRREAVAVDRERAARRDLVRIGGPHDQRAEAAHLLVQQADRAGLPVIGAKRVGADELGESRRPVGCGGIVRTHLVQHDREAVIRDLPGGLGAGKAAADDMDGMHGSLSAQYRSALDGATSILLLVCTARRVTKNARQRRALSHWDEFLLNLNARL